MDATHSPAHRPLAQSCLRSFSIAPVAGAWQLTLSASGEWNIFTVYRCQTSQPRPDAVNREGGERAAAELLTHTYTDASSDSKLAAQLAGTVGRKWRGGGATTAPMCTEKGQESDTGA